MCVGGGGGRHWGLKRSASRTLYSRFSPYFFGSRFCAILRLRNIAQCCVFFLLFPSPPLKSPASRPASSPVSRAPPAPFLQGSAPLSPPPLERTGLQLFSPPRDLRRSSELRKILFIERSQHNLAYFSCSTWDSKL